MAGGIIWLLMLQVLRLDPKAPKNDKSCLMAELSGGRHVVPAPDLEACSHDSKEDSQYQQALKPLYNCDCIHFLHQSNPFSFV